MISQKEKQFLLLLSSKKREKPTQAKILVAKTPLQTDRMPAAWEAESHWHCYDIQYPCSASTSSSGHEGKSRKKNAGFL